MPHLAPAPRDLQAVQRWSERLLVEVRFPLTHFDPAASLHQPPSQGAMSNPETCLANYALKYIWDRVQRMVLRAGTTGIPEHLPDCRYPIVPCLIPQAHCAQPRVISERCHHLTVHRRARPFSPHDQVGGSELGDHY